MILFIGKGFNMIIGMNVQKKSDSLLMDRLRQSPVSFTFTPVEADYFPPKNLRFLMTFDLFASYAFQDQATN